MRAAALAPFSLAMMCPTGAEITGLVSAVGLYVGIMGCLIAMFTWKDLGGGRIHRMQHMIVFECV